MKKRILSLMLCMVMLLTLCSCGSSESKGVPETQVTADVNTLAQNDLEFECALLETGGTFNKIEIEHNYDKDSHIDNATLHYFYDSWMGEIELVKRCSYQYSRESDIWSLLGSETAEIANVKFNAEALADRLEGTVESGCYSHLTASIDSVDASSYPLVLDISCIFNYSDNYIVDSATVETTVSTRIYEDYDYYRSGNRNDISYDYTIEGTFTVPDISYYYYGECGVRIFDDDVDIGYFRNGNID